MKEKKGLSSLACEVLVFLSFFFFYQEGQLKLTVSSYDVHLQPEALLPVMVQRFGCRVDREGEKNKKNIGVNIRANALILHWPLNSPSWICTNTWLEC